MEDLIGEGFTALMPLLMATSIFTLRRT